MESSKPDSPIDTFIQEATAWEGKPLAAAFTRTLKAANRVLDELKVAKDTNRKLNAASKRQIDSFGFAELKTPDDLLRFLARRHKLAFDGTPMVKALLTLHQQEVNHEYAKLEEEISSERSHLDVLLNSVFELALKVNATALIKTETMDWQAMYIEQIELVRDERYIKNAIIANKDPASQQFVKDIEKQLEDIEDQFKLAMLDEPGVTLKENQVRLISDKKIEFLKAISMRLIIKHDWIEYYSNELNDVNISDLVVASTILPPKEWLQYYSVSSAVNFYHYFILQLKEKTFLFNLLIRQIKDSHDPSKMTANAETIRLQGELIMSHYSPNGTKAPFLGTESQIQEISTDILIKGDRFDFDDFFQEQKTAYQKYYDYLSEEIKKGEREKDFTKHTPLKLWQLELFGTNITIDEENKTKEKLKKQQQDFTARMTHTKSEAAIEKPAEKNYLPTDLEHMLKLVKTLPDRFSKVRNTQDTFSTNDFLEDFIHAEIMYIEVNNLKRDVMPSVNLRPETCALTTLGVLAKPKIDSTAAKIVKDAEKLLDNFAEDCKRHALESKKMLSDVFPSTEIAEEIIARLHIYAKDYPEIDSKENKIFINLYIYQHKDEVIGMRRYFENPAKACDYFIMRTFFFGMKEKVLNLQDTAIFLERYVNFLNFLLENKKFGATDYDNYQFKTDHFRKAATTLKNEINHIANNIKQDSLLESRTLKK